MGAFSNVGRSLRERNRFVAAALGSLAIALAAFFAGTWAGSSGALTLTSSPAETPSAPMGPDMQNSPLGKMCCDHMQDMMKNMPGMPMKPGQMPNAPTR
jgi:hypothetical protein